MALKSSNKKDYTRISNGSIHSSDNNNAVENNTSALAKLKRKLQSFENPAYDKLKEDGFEETPSPSRTSSKVLLDSTEDLNLRTPSNQPSKRRRQRRKKIALVICVLILIVLICIIAAIASYIATRPDTNKITINPVTTTKPQHIPVSSNISVTNILLCNMKVVGGNHNNFKPAYSNAQSSDFKNYENVLCDTVKNVFSDPQDNIKSLYKGCILNRLRNGSVLVDFLIILNNNISIDSTNDVENIKYSIKDIINIFTNHFTSTRTGNRYILKTGWFIIEKETFNITAGSPSILQTTASTISATTVTTTSKTTPTTIQTTSVSTVSPDVGNCNSTQFFCPSGVITLQHRKGRTFCIDQNEKCDGYKDCLGGEDESECGDFCSNGGFRCQGDDAVDVILNSQCTWSGEKCDGVGDCSDFSDEKDCPCLETDFRCINGTDKRNRDFCIPKFYTCDKENDCTDGSDEMNCTYTCKEEQFMCTTATIARPPFHGYCIEAHEVCDGHQDCWDNSDEFMCNETCPGNKFRCNTTDIYEITYCIPHDYKCDGVPDCKNSTDEDKCEYKCDEDMFKCETGVIARWPYRGFCLYKHERCNGVKECGDNSDEENCEEVTKCKSDEHRCKNGTNIYGGDYCIPQSYVCDRRIDCTDRSDESECTYTCNKDGLHGYYLCTNGTLLNRGDTSSVGRGYCLPGHTKCDGIVHCEDQSDEKGCDETCGSNLFRCMNGTSTHTVTGHMCIPNGFLCDRDNDCSDGSDELNCNYTCQPHQWPCEKQMLARWPYWGFCIWERERCDGYFDCEDHSDEKNCGETQCSEDQFMCNNGTNIYFDSSCIPISEHCDRHVQCLDGSDEEDCDYDCKEDEFMCVANKPGTRHCISLTSLCDGTSDCSDSSDENNCRQSCTINQFKCVQGHDRFSGTPCIDKHMKCDRVTDCTDGSDEGEDVCEYTCGQGMFACVNGTLAASIERGSERRGFCLPPHMKCNKAPECEDGSDEELNMCANECGNRFFMCVNGTDRFSTSKCVPLSYKCDRQNDCTDGSDEVDCIYDKCNEGQWKCETSIIKRWPRQGYCIKMTERCDGVHDCLDLSDEKGCNGTNCKHERGKSFVCENGTDKLHGDACIPKSYQCDRTIDCTDGSDETNCTYRCDPGLVACKTGLISKAPYRGFCLYPRDHCNRVKDCADGSDEEDCDDVKCGSHEFKCRSQYGSIQDGSRCIPAKWRCDKERDCADGSDEGDDCIYHCNEDQFQCKNGSIFRWPYYGFCIKKSDVCDGYQDCDDWSDEAKETCDPETIHCPDDHFKCHNETVTSSNRKDVCIHNWLRCDRYNNCPDKSDERNCNYKCEEDQFMCKTSTVTNYPNYNVSNYCIQKRQKCDGIVQCADQSDENNCGSNCSEHNHFRCFNGLDISNTTACIESYKRCDGIKHCKDGSDEKNCPSNGGNTCSSGHIKCPKKPIWYYRSSVVWCLEQKYKCDKFVDCGDHFDEENCDYTCESNQFTCGYKNNTLGAICISRDMLCNNDTNCHSGSDEDAEMCRMLSTCSSTDQIPCANGYSVNDSPSYKCVPLSKRCDHVNDCSDGSDEKNC